MLFFATPHSGLKVEDIKKMIAGHVDHPRNALLRQIDENSDLLLSQLANFKDVIHDRRIVSFYETEQTRLLEFVSCL